LSRSCPTKNFLTTPLSFPFVSYVMLPPFFTSMAAGGRGGEKDMAAKEVKRKWDDVA
jgi:hypothetical protein